MITCFQVTLTEFKPVWPASGRDFCNLAVIREMTDGLFCQVYEAVGISGKTLAPLSSLTRWNHEDRIQKFM